MSGPRIGSLFSGAGGLDMAVEAVFSGTVAWHCEIDKAASKVLAHRWPGVPNWGDISDIYWGLVEPIDILCGGFPCQDVSAAGKRAGIREGTRSGLWSYFADAIDTLRPKIVIIENVRGLLNATAHRNMESTDTTVGNGTGRPVLRAAGAVLGDLADLGYDAAWTTLAASEVGAPHQRARVFIFATHTGSQGHGGPGQHQLDGAGNPGLVESVHCRTQSQGIQRQRSWQIISHRGDQGTAVDLLLPTPCARDHKDGDYPSSYGRNTPSLGAIKHYLPTPEAKNSHAGQDFARANRPGSGGDDLVTAIIKGNDNRWGKYAAAIGRWEHLTRPAPYPTERNSNGNPRLNPAFAEWMMGWPAGWVTDPAIGISRNDQLRIIGNGVVPQQAAAALQWLLSVSEVAA